MLGTRAKIPGDCSSCGRQLWQWLVWNLKPHIDFTFQHQKVGWFDFQLFLFGNCFALGGVVFQWFNCKPGDQSSLVTYDFTSGRLLWQRCFDQTLQSLCKDQHRIFAGGPPGSSENLPYIWVNYNELTTSEPWKSWLVNYYNLPRYILVMFKAIACGDPKK